MENCFQEDEYLVEILLNMNDGLRMVNLVVIEYLLEEAGLNMNEILKMVFIMAIEYLLILIKVSLWVHIVEILKVIYMMVNEHLLCQMRSQMRREYIKELGLRDT
jgi:hypothetical protein